MKVSELMTGANVTTLPPETPVVDARRRMLAERIRHLLVTENGRLVGIVTDRDIRLNLPSQATSLSVWEINHLLTKLTIGEVMTRTVITIGPDRDARDAAELMLDHSIGALPVTDGGALIGIITETDILRGFVWLTGGPAASHPATCSPETGPIGVSESARLPAGRTPPCGASASRRSRSSGS